MVLSLSFLKPFSNNVILLFNVSSFVILYLLHKSLNLKKEPGVKKI